MKELFKAWQAQGEAEVDKFLRMITALPTLLSSFFDARAPRRTHARRALLVWEPGMGDAQAACEALRRTCPSPIEPSAPALLDGVVTILLLCLGCFLLVKGGATLERDKWRRMSDTNAAAASSPPARKVSSSARQGSPTHVAANVAGATAEATKRAPAPARAVKSPSKRPSKSPSPTRAKSLRSFLADVNHDGKITYTQHAHAHAHTHTPTHPHPHTHTGSNPSHSPHDPL